MRVLASGPSGADEILRVLGFRDSGRVLTAFEDFEGFGEYRVLDPAWTL